MKRVNHLLDAIADRDNLRLAYHKAMRGKRHRAEARQFGTHLEDRLAEMAEQLRAGTVPVGEYHQFVIYDPKERVITAPCFRERVLHHAIVNVGEPHFERWLIADTFACRKGKGRLAALARAREFAGRYGWYLKLDVRKYFDSVSHDRLLARLGRKIKDGRLLELLERIVRSYRGEVGRGLPIGSLTSQHFANFYLDGLDRLVKERLRIRGYVRYVDDVALWSGDKADLKRACVETAAFLRDELELQWRPNPYLNRVARGMDFLGCRVFPTHLVLNRRSRVRYRRRLARLEALWEQGRMDEAELQQRVTAATAFVCTAGLSSWKFRQATVQCGRSAVTGLEPGEPGRQLEQ